MSISRLPRMRNKESASFSEIRIYGTTRFFFLVDFPFLRSFCPRKSYLCPALHTVPHYPQLNLNMSDALRLSVTYFHPFRHTRCHLSILYSCLRLVSDILLAVNYFLKRFGCLIQLAQFLCFYFNPYGLFIEQRKS